MNTYKKDRGSDVRLQQAGESFGRRVAEAINSAKTVSVIIDHIDGDYAMVTIFEGDEPIPVPLKLLAIDDVDIKTTPSIGSTAIIGMSNGDVNRPYFIRMSKVDKIEFMKSSTTVSWLTDPADSTKDEFKLSVGSSSIRMVGDLIEINEGKNAGLVLIEALTDRLNKLQGEINNINAAYKSHTHDMPYNGGSVPALGTTLATTSTANDVSSFAKSEYENIAVTQ